MEIESLNLIEKVFGKRNEIIKNNIFELRFFETSKVNNNSNLDFKLSLLMNIGEEKFPLEIKTGTLDIKEIKEIWNCFNKKYNEIEKSTKVIDVWPEIFSENLERLKVNYNCDESKYAFMLEDLNRIIVLTNEFFIFENYSLYYETEMVSYEDMGIVVNLIRKEQFQLKMKNLY
jgi:hypothetical protein